ncbi:MAG: metal-dependent transcriptional regulator [Clostridia bacterium]|nr:metal-dependent transcriptional regulator [Oscillospiraceae bacterium]MBQ2829079.1 metal-dependent transcriptional regulator [Clostridia bacterium]
MKVLESGENYLETILMLNKQNNNETRAIDVTNALGFSKPTVSVMLKQLRENGYVTVNEKGYIALTEKGLEIANKIYEKHVVIAKALIKIGVEHDIAYKDACKIEHDISDETFTQLKKFLDK